MRHWHSIISNIDAVLYSENRDVLGTEAFATLAHVSTRFWQLQLRSRLHALLAGAQKVTNCLHDHPSPIPYAEVSHLPPAAVTLCSASWGAYIRNDARPTQLSRRWFSSLARVPPALPSRCRLWQMWLRMTTGEMHLTVQEAKMLCLTVIGGGRYGLWWSSASVSK